VYYYATQGGVQLDSILVSDVKSEVEDYVDDLKDDIAEINPLSSYHSVGINK
jgi:hypothetical protein